MSAVYEIHLQRPGGALAIVMKVMCVGDADAKNQAIAMLYGSISNAHIWRDDVLIGSVRRWSARDQPGQAARPCSVCGEPSVAPEELALDGGLVCYCPQHLREYDPVATAFYDRQKAMRAIVDFLGL
jgi:hypothetical protein